MSFLGYMVNRDERPAVTFEATFANHYVIEEVRAARNEGFDVEDMGTFAKVGVRIVYVRHEDGRPWIFREFYVEKESE